MSNDIDQIAHMITEDPDVLNEIQEKTPRQDTWMGRLKSRLGLKSKIQPTKPATTQIQELRMALSRISKDQKLAKAFSQGAINIQRRGWTVVPREGEFGGMTSPLWGLLRKYIGDRVINSIVDGSIRFGQLDAQLKAEQAKETKTTRRIEQPKQ